MGQRAVVEKVEPPTAAGCASVPGEVAGTGDIRYNS
jgi:hypothetical protein